MKNKNGIQKGKKLLSVLLYLVLVSLFLGLSPGELLDLRQLLLVLAGGMILYLPGVEREDIQKKRKPDWELFARNTVYASFLEAFVLIFIMLSDRGMAGRQWTESGRWLQEMLMREMALNLRPLLYGGCIWVAFGNDRTKKENGWTEQQWTNGWGRKGEGGEGGNERRETERRAWTAGEAYMRFQELGLTRREAEVAVQVCKGLSNKEIAMELSISETTVKKHVSNIFEKLEVERRREIGERLDG